jgi:hypothetical protein
MKRMHYKDALVYANSFTGSVFMISNADAVVGGGFDSVPSLNSFLRENDGEKTTVPGAVPPGATAIGSQSDALLNVCNRLVLNLSLQGFPNRGLCCSETNYDGCHDGCFYVLYPHFELPP